MLKREPFETEKETLEDLLAHVTAELTSQRIVTDLIVCALCVDVRGLIGSSLLRALDVIQGELEANFGHHDLLAASLRERRECLHDLMIERALEKVTGSSH